VSLSSLLTRLTAFLAYIATTFPYDETAITHPFSATATFVELQMRFQICLFKGGAVFFCPQQRPGFFMLYGYSVCLKRHVRASPFLAADVAEKTERKAFFVRMVCGCKGQRFAHMVILAILF
jgi:hypothetical protein